MPADIVLMIRSESLKGSAVRALRKELRRMIAPGRRLILNLANVAQLNTEAAALVMETARALRSCGGSLKLVGVQSKVNLLFELLGLRRVVEMHNSQTEALAFGEAA